MTLPEDIAWLKRFVEFFIKFFPPEKRTPDVFFMFALERYYSPMQDGMPRRAGHLLYRLSDFLDAEDRANIAVHPCFGHEEDVEQYGPFVEIDEGRWISLEGWRKEWECSCSPIPPLFRNIPRETLRLLPEKLQNR